MRLINKNTRGDTIVEVLLCIAIVGAVITGAYAIASRSLQQGVQASERTQAIKLAEAQVETLKFRKKNTIHEDTWNNYFAGGITPPYVQNSCLNTDPSITTEEIAGVPVPNWLPQRNANGSTAFIPENLGLPAGPDPLNQRYDATCVVSGGNNPQKYFINITTRATASVTPTYLVTVRWIASGNSPQNQVQLYYRF